MASSDPERRSEAQITRLPLGRSRQRLSFERRLRLWLYAAGVPALVLVAAELQHFQVDAAVRWIVLPSAVAGWLLLVSLIVDQVLRPLQTLANVVAALREDDYSFRARGGRRNDAMGDLALEVNALAGMLQAQRVGAMEAMELVERVMKAMQSPVLAFDPEGRLKLLNSAAERAFHLRLQAPRKQDSLVSEAGKLDLERLLRAEDNDLLSHSDKQQGARWVVKRTSFRLRGIPHSLFVLSDVSDALREEERLAWERLIRVLGHEINNSLTPIKSIAGSLRSRLVRLPSMSEDDEDFERGLEVIEDRADSLNRFLQAYRELMGLPAPRLQALSIAAIVRRVSKLETRVLVVVIDGEDLIIRADPDQLAQALINLVRNAAEASVSVEHAVQVETKFAVPRDGLGRVIAPQTVSGEDTESPRVEICWEQEGAEVLISIIDNGPGLINAANLFVPFYTTKPKGTGIGLVLAQQIAMAHSGSVQLSNRLDSRGCRAVFRVPVNAGD